MKEITIKQAEKLSAPNPFALVVSADEEGKPNVMAVSWWTYAANNPPTLLICLGMKSYTRELIEKTGEFTLCLADEALRDAAFRCGTCSGRTVDKAGEFAIALEPSAAVAPPYVRDSKVVFACRVADTAAAGDHRVFIAEVAAVYADEGKRHLFAMDGYARLDTAKE